MRKVWIVLIGLAVAAGAVWFFQARRAAEPQGPAAVEPQSEQAALLQQIQSLVRRDGDLPALAKEAQALYRRLETGYPATPEAEQAARILEDFNVRLLFSSVQTPDSGVYEVQPGDTLSAIARRYRTTVDMLRRINGIEGDLIWAGQKLKVTSGSDLNIFVDKSENTLRLRRGDEIIKTYTVSTGENGSTPVGEFEVTDKLIDPTWYKAGAVVPPDSPENILGSRWMGIGVPGYGIHGTTQPEMLGRSVTNGCVRMLNRDVEEVFAIVPPGTKVVIVD